MPSDQIGREGVPRRGAAPPSKLTVVKRRVRSIVKGALHEIDSPKGFGDQRRREAPPICMPLFAA